MHTRWLALTLKARRLTYLDIRALLDLSRSASTLTVPGDVVEAGCALGGSSAMLAAAIGGSRKLHLYDTFATIPPPSDSDGVDIHERYRVIEQGMSSGIRGDVYYGYRGDLRDQVRATVATYAPQAQLELHPGLYQDTFRPHGPVALAHLDCDWYDSVMVCLERVWPEMPSGGRVIVDDYDTWSGARKAVDEFCRAVPVRIERHARLHLMKP